MKSKYRIAAAPVGLLVLAALALPLRSQAEEQPIQLNPVSIQGVSGTILASLEKLNKGRQAFERSARRTDAMSLRWQIRHRTGDAKAAGQTRLQLQTEAADFALPLADDGTFVLPAEVSGVTSGQILASHKQLLIRPLVETQGSSPEQRYLGDLRLECEVFWAMEKDEVPALMRMAFSMAGGACNSGRIEMPSLSPFLLEAATLTYEGRELPLRLGKTLRDYRAPLHDSAWPDRALVRLVPKPAKAESGAQ